MVLPVFSASVTPVHCTVICSVSITLVNFPLSLSQLHYLPASSSSSKHLLDSHTDADSSCGSIDLLLLLCGGGACHEGYDGCAGVWQLTLSLRLGLMGPLMEAIVLVLMNVEPLVEVAWVKVEAATKASVPLEVTNF